MRFSIVIPTRNRPEYLRHCLQTCLAQEEAADEILVCDNSSPELAAQTERVVIESGAAVVRYLPPDGRPLNMTDNWNRALSHVTGDYVTVIGDDDGLLPACVRVAKACANRFRCDAIRWGWAFYHWPCFKYCGLANRGFVPLPTNSDTAAFQRVSTKPLLQRVVNGRAPYVALPMLYNAFVHRRVLQAIQADSSPLLDALSPDIYSGLAIAAIAADVLTTDFPLAIAGQSGASNGAAHENQDRTSAIADDFVRLNEAQRIGQLRGTIPVGKLSLAVTDAFVRLKDRVPNRLAGIEQRPRCLAFWQASDLGEMDRSLPHSGDTEAYQQLVDHFRGVPLAASAIRRGYAAGHARSPDYPPNGIHSQQLFFDATTFGAVTVSDVATILTGVVGSPRHVVSGWGMKPRLKHFLNRWAPPAVKDGVFEMGRRLGINPGNQ